MPGRLVFSTTPSATGTPQERLRITSAGLVGIGTSTPSDILTVKQAVNGDNQITIYNDDTTSGSALQTNSISFDFARTGSSAIQRSAAVILAGKEGEWTSASTSQDGYLAFYTTINASNTTEKVRITSGGYVGIGTTSPGAPLSIYGDSVDLVSAYIENNNAAGPASTSRRLVLAQGGTTAFSVAVFQNAGIVESTGAGGGLALGAYSSASTDPIKFYTGSGRTERARIDGSGRLLVGTSTARSNVIGSTGKFQLEGVSGCNQTLVNNQASANDAQLLFGKTRGASAGSNTAVISGDALGLIAFGGADGTNIIQAANIRAEVDGTPGANDMPGRLVFSTTADGASTPTERMRIASNGTVTIGQTVATNTDSGHYFLAGGAVGHFRDSEPALAIGRFTDDGTLVSFQQNATEEGSISVSGSTVTLNGAHLSRWSQIPGIDPYNKAVRPDILRGTVMSNLDEMCDWTCPTSGDCQNNEQLNKTKISDVEGDKNVAGIFQSWDDDDDTWVNDYYLAMTGDFVIRIAAGTTVERGDLLMSAGDGTAKPQADDLVRSCTVAKVTSTTVSCTHPDGSYCVPCVLMAC